MERVVAIVPAKAYSRRLPGKNLLHLGGIPLFMHSVNVALESPMISDVIVSSDSQEILELAQDCGALALKRPKALCGDTVPNFKVCQHVVEALNDSDRRVDCIALLQPTQPFRSVEGIDDAITRLSKHTVFDSLTSVTKVHRLTGRVKNNQWSPASIQNGERAQAKGTVFEMTGHLFLLKVKKTIMLDSLLGKSIFAWQLPETWIDIDIDTVSDFVQAQAMMAHRSSIKVNTILPNGL